MKKKIYELALSPELLRREFWQQVAPDFLNWEFIDIQTDLDGLRKQWKEISKNAQYILVDELHSGFLLKIIPGVSRRILEIDRIDSIFIDEKGNLWPNCFTRESLHELIVAKASNLDTSAKAYITGQDSKMRVALSVAVQLGYRQINLISENESDSVGSDQIFKKLFFETQVKRLKNTDLTLQKNDGTLLINTLDLHVHKELAEDLTFLNFIYGEGLVVDTQQFQSSNSVLDEALHVGLRVLTGLELQALTDYKTLVSILGKAVVPFDSYLKSWSEFVKQKPAKGPVTN